MVFGEPEAAIEVGREALALAERIGADDLRAHNLITIGTARGNLGDTGGIADVEQGLSLALAGNALSTASRAYNNLGVLVSRLLADTQRSRSLMEEALAIAERMGDREGVRFDRVQLTGYQFQAGEWDAALEAADAFIVECEAGSEHILEARARQVRAAIRSARGDVAAAGEDIERALAHTRKAGSAESLRAILAEFSWLNVELGRTEEAKRLADELVAASVEDDAAVLRPAFALVAEGLGFLEEVRRRAAETKLEYRDFVEITRAIVDERLTEAADLASSRSGFAFAADLRLCAARAFAEKAEPRLAEEQLEQALAFYRSVGATRYIREGEELLERLQQATAR